MRVENQPYGRLSRDHLRPRVHHASVQAPDDRQHGGSRGRVDRRRARLPRAPTTFRRTPRVTIVGDFDIGAGAADGDAVLRPRAEGAAPRAARHSEGAAADQGAARRGRGGLAAAGGRRRLPRAPTTGIRTPTRCTSPSKILSDGQSARIPRELVYNKRLALTAFGSGNITEDPNLFYAVASSSPGRRRPDAEQALIAEFEKLKTRAGGGHRAAAREEPVRARLHPRPRVEQDKALHLAHAAVIHNDITTADGEFDIFMKHQRRRRAARGAVPTSTTTNRVVAPHPAQGRKPRDEVHATHPVPGAGGWRVSRSCAVSAASAQTLAPFWPSEAPPRPLAAREVKFPPYEVRTLRQRHAGRGRAAPRAAGGHDAAARSRRRRAGSASARRRGEPRRQPAGSGDHHEERASRSPTRSTSSAARWAPGPGWT